MAERHVAGLIAEAFRRGGMLRAVRKAEAVVAWPHVVGPEVARFARARALRSGVLFVDVPDSETAMHLALQRARFLDAYERHLGRREVRDIRFAAGRPVTSEPAPAPPSPQEPDPDAWADLNRRLGALDLPEALAGPTLRAGRAFLVHRERAKRAGWRPCPHCGALSPDDGPCDACLRHRSAPAVQRAARTLSLRPDQATPLLSDEERKVAEDLACEALDERMLEALPQVVATPALRPQLAAAARNRLALALGIAPSEVGSEHLERLDPRIGRVLAGTLPARSPRGGPHDPNDEA
ncbi:MAG: DUF721 domain-containing protein [Trueperaceae bacterium]